MSDEQVLGEEVDEMMDDVWGVCPNCAGDNLMYAGVQTVFCESVVMLYCDYCKVYININELDHERS